MLRLHLDRHSPVPLYHQIVQAIRWRIGTGVLRPGDPLPPIREAAEAWDVNYHTVRRAYHDLAADGWVESLQGAGTQVAVVLPGSDGTQSDVLDHWLDEMIATASERFGLAPAALARRVVERRPADCVVMVECNAHQSSLLARQLEHAWPVEAIPWSLERTEELPRLPIIGTYFHHGEMRRRWPDRVGDMHFVTLYIDPGLLERIESEAARRHTRVLRLVERDPGTATEMAASITPLLPRFTIEPLVGDPQRVLDALPPSELLLVAPRLWDDLTAATRQDPRVFDVRPLIVPDDLQRVWRAINASAVHATGSRAAPKSGRVVPGTNRPVPEHAAIRRS